MKNYTQFDNSLLEFLYKSNLTSSEIRIYLMIIRFTTGYHREEAPLSISFIAKETGLHHTTVVSSLKRLQKKGYIVRSNRTSKGTMTSIGSSVETTSVETTSVETSSLYNSSVETTKGSSVETTPTSSVDATHIKKKEIIKERDISKENGSYVEVASKDAPTTDPIKKEERLTGYDRRKARITQKIPK